jgi:lysophospholipase L1-like esterase
MVHSPERYICNDGIHLSPEGHKLFAELLFEVLEQQLIRNGHDSNGT